MKKIHIIALAMIFALTAFAESKNLVKLSDDNFQKEVIDSKEIVLVDFWAPWCAPCKKLGPIIEELSEKYDGQVKFGKLNVDNNRKMAGKFGIRSIPTVAIFKDGKPIDGFVGLKSKTDIEKILSKYNKQEKTIDKNTESSMNEKK